MLHLQRREVRDQLVLLKNYVLGIKLNDGGWKCHEPNMQCTTPLVCRATENRAILIAFCYKCVNTTCQHGYSISYELGELFRTAFYILRGTPYSPFPPPQSKHSWRVPAWCFGDCGKAREI